MNKNTAIQSAQLQQLISVSKFSLIASILLSLILAYMQRDVIAPEVLIFWCAAVVVASLLRMYLVVAFQRPAASKETIRIRLWKFRLAALVTAAIWGAAGFLLYPDGHSGHQMFLIFALAGMTAGGVVSFSADRFSAIAFSILITAPIISRLFISGSSFSLAMSVATTLYLGFMILSIWRINQQVIENFTLRLEAAGREEKIRASEERYRSLLAHLPVGILHYDSNLVISYCNNSLATMLNSSVERIHGVDMRQLRDQSLLPALEKSLTGRTGYYEGLYQATYTDVRKWIAMTCAPFFDGKGEIIGGTAIVQDVTERKEAEEKIKSLAFYDPLTNLPNRRLLLDRLQHAMATSARTGKKGALLFIDLDNFKTLNDTLGHDMGDLLLQQVSQRLLACVREGDTVARLGGDEFVIMLEDLDEQALEAAEQTEVIGEKLITFLARPYQLAAHEYRTTSSIGATLINGHWQARDELLKQADIAMYQAKKTGRNILRFFDQEMQDAVTARALLEGQLRTAIDREQFKLHYQVQVDSSRNPVGAEALIRWMHPERGLVYPDHFIHVAEETELILPIGRWVLETACAQLKAWQDNESTRHLALAVNVCASQFREDSFVAEVQAAIQRHAINPMLLNLELTESALLENIEETIDTMNALRKIGVRFSLDDFGTGYSSLQYLKRLPLDQLKIDRSFVHEVSTNDSDREIVRTIIAMAGSMNLGTIAEGVETEEQHQFLRENGCNHFQGYLFGKPVPIDQFNTMLKSDSFLPA